MSDDDGQYFVNKRAGRLYISKRFGEVNDVRIISEIYEGDQDDHFALIKDELVIRRTPRARFEIKATLTEDDRDIKVLTLQQWSVDRGYAHEKTHFSFHGAEISRLLDFVRRVKAAHLDDPHSKVVNIEDLVEITLTSEQAKRLISERQDLVIDFATNEITRQDIVALAYRKQELAYFERLLSDDNFLPQKKSELERKAKLFGKPSLSVMIGFLGTVCLMLL